MTFLLLLLLVDNRSATVPTVDVVVVIGIMMLMT